MAKINLGKLLQPAYLRRDLTRELVTVEKKLLHAGEVSNGGWQWPRELVIRETNLTEIKSNGTNLRKLSREKIVLKLYLGEVGKPK